MGWINSWDGDPNDRTHSYIEYGEQAIKQTMRYVSLQRRQLHLDCLMFI